MPLKSSENIEISETDGSIRFMSLKKVDEGSYTCNATNSVGYNTGVGKVKVLGECQLWACLLLIPAQVAMLLIIFITSVFQNLTESYT